jgi:hypothetical protein
MLASIPGIAEKFKSIEMLLKLHFLCGNPTRRSLGSRSATYETDTDDKQHRNDQNPSHGLDLRKENQLGKEARKDKLCQIGANVYRFTAANNFFATRGPTPTIWPTLPPLPPAVRQVEKVRGGETDDCRQASLKSH